MRATLAMDKTVIEKAAEWGFRLNRKGKNVSATDIFIAILLSTVILKP